jgi:hypothetical protein
MVICSSTELSSQLAKRQESNLYLRVSPALSMSYSLWTLRLAEHGRALRTAPAGISEPEHKAARKEARE